MDAKAREARLQKLRSDMNATVVRIRRYSVDPRTAKQDDVGTALRGQADRLWERWLTLYKAIANAPAELEEPALVDLEAQYLNVDHQTDLLQRELISEASSRAGMYTIVGLALALATVAVVYVWSHLVHDVELATWSFEPWSEWGPLKYGEVMLWGLAGCLCYLLITASIYLMRRDFDPWYRGWYVAVALRSPFITALLMVIILEFVEWYSDDPSWIRTYILEEGNKYYFIAFMSFCLGLASNSASTVARDLSAGVVELVAKSVARVVDKLKNAVGEVSATTKH
jgi:hypothetical protein